jgi:hypothetical protein
LLDNHSQVSAPAPVHFCDVFVPLIAKYGCLRRNKNAIKLMGHMIRYANSEFSDWKIKKRADAIVTGYHVDSFSSAFNAIYTEKALQESAISWFCKDNNMHQYAFSIIHNLRGVKFIYLYRDPRDQVASWMRNPLFLLTPKMAICKWVEEQQAIKQLIDAWQLNPVFVKYEELVSDTERVMQNLLEQVGLPVEAACFQTSGKHVEAKKFKLWENIEKPIIQDNYGRYMDILSHADVGIIEKCAGFIMDWLGYHAKMKASKRIESSIRYRIHEFRLRMRNNAKMIRDMKLGEHKILYAKRAVRSEILKEIV